MKKIILLLVFFTVGFSLAAAQNTVTSVTGNVTEVNHPVALLSAGDGTVYKMFLGPYWYWKNNGYNLLMEQATVKGLIDGKNIHPYEITQNGKTIKLKDENGIALWGGKGNGRGKGYGRGYCKGPCGNYMNGVNDNNYGYCKGKGNCPNCPNCPYNKNN